MNSNLHIGYDAKRAYFNPTGLGNYSRNLLWALAKYYPHLHYHLYSPKAASASTEPWLQQPPFIAHSPKGWIDRMFPALWRSFMMGSQIAGDGIQLFHGLSNELPMDMLESKVPSVVTIHDLIFLDHPGLYPTLDRQIYRTKSSMACERASHIMAISEQTKQSIIKHFGTRESKISVVYQSCHPAFMEVPAYDHLIDVKHRYHLPERYLLYVGSIAERKQTLPLVQAFGAMSDISLKLVIVGAGGGYKQQVLDYVTSHQLTDRVIFLSQVPSMDLVAVYRQALVLVYPSLMEGFGIPIIEAMHSGVPVITTAGGCFEEAGGNAARYVPAGDVNALGLAMSEVTQSTPLREDMVAKGYAHAQHFTPQAFADGVMEVYRKAML
jgi:glycosyltransferase involved in cell wall biosynthesis